ADAAFARGLAIVTFVCAIGTWYGGPLLWRSSPTHRREEDMGMTTLDEKLHHVLTEARVVLPGTQTMLGFQPAGGLQGGYDALPLPSKVIHLVGFAFLGVSVIVLLLPAAFHRIAARGENDEALHRLTSGCILVAMTTLSGAIACDVHVVVRKATASAAIG